MGKKYIIELEDKPVCVFDEDTQTFFPRLHRVKGFNSLVFDQNGLDKLTSYTEPDLDAIRNEAYEKGVQDTKQHWVDAPRTCAYKLGYENGLKVAWEAARKICTNWVLPDSVLSKIFGIDKTIDDVMKENTASEAIEKIRQYEQEQDRQARIKFNCDEIKDVINTTMKECNVSLDEIAEVLRKMKENSDG